MKTFRFVVFAVTLASLFTSLELVHAQYDRRAQEGSTRPILISISVTPIPDAPFSATVFTDWTNRFADGTTRTIKNHRTIARDSAGRIFQERRFLTPDSDKQETRITQLEFSDPTTNEQYMCDPYVRACQLYNYFPSTASATNGRFRVEAGDVKSEDLGHDVIEGLDTAGTRETTVIPEGVIGNDRPLAVVKEFWFSPRLGLDLVTNRVDPRSGSAKFRVTNINLSEPDSKLFMPPSDFTVIDGRKPAAQ